MNKLAVHKYIFFINDEGIRTYKYINENKFEIFKYKGESICTIKEFKSFYEWFNKAAAIAGDDEIDLCFLAEQVLDIPLANSLVAATSSWKKDNILHFCKMHMGEINYKIIIDDEKQFVYQVGNVYDENNVKNLYMKCFPEFSYEKVTETDLPKENIAFVNMYFIESLSQI